MKCEREGEANEEGGGGAIKNQGAGSVEDVKDNGWGWRWCKRGVGDKEIPFSFTFFLYLKSKSSDEARKPTATAK